jgi:hypothetical protein
MVLPSKGLVLKQVENTLLAKPHRPIPTLLRLSVWRTIRTPLTGYFPVYAAYKNLLYLIFELLQRG